MKLLTVIGARPQFIKAAAMSRAIREWNAMEFQTIPITDVVIHTGQHYDENMSKIFFDQLQMPPPRINLGIGSGTRGWQTGEMIIRLENAIRQQAPDWVLVYGDTNSTLAGALAAVSLRVPVAHIEAGLRSYNRDMPEEINRVLTDHCSDLLFCPTLTAVDNLAREAILEGVHLVGDVMHDVILQYRETAAQRSSILRELGLREKEYLLLTVHRPSNADDHEHMANILDAVVEADVPTVFPVHPRTRKLLETEQFAGFTRRSCLRFIDAVGYLDMIALELSARIILTDSGGIQKEAYWLGVPCITLREETEWVETVEGGWNRLAGADKKRIIDALRRPGWPANRPPYCGDGHAARKILDTLIAYTLQRHGPPR